MSLSANGGRAAVFVESTRLPLSVNMSCCCCRCCCSSSCVSCCRAADSSAHYSAKNQKLRLRTWSVMRTDFSTGGGDAQVEGTNHRHLFPGLHSWNGRGPGFGCTLVSRTPPPSWIALSSPAEADTDASSWLVASRCAELSAAPMANNHTTELSLPLKTAQKSDHTGFLGFFFNL